MFQNQIIIGTANFNQNYGFSTTKVKYNKTHLRFWSILKRNFI